MTCNIKRVTIQIYKGDGTLREYLEQIMHQSITEHPYDSVEKLPLGCRNAFELTIIEIQNQEILLATPVDTMNVTELRKMRIQLERYRQYHSYSSFFHLQ